MGGLRLGLLGFGASVLVVLGACGGRTSMLDPDATVMIDTNQPSGGSASKPGTGIGATAGTGAGGSGTSSGVGASGGTAPTVKPPLLPPPPPPPVSSGGAQGIGGTGSAGMAPSAGASTGRGGSTGIGEVDDWAFTNCITYCNTSAPAQPCTSGLSSAKCASACTAQLGGLDLACQKVAGNLLACLTTVYQNSRNCADVQQLSSAKCSNWFASYDLCAGNSQVPPPPPPACSGYGSNGNGKCVIQMKCENGARYTASCYEANPGQSNCTCDGTLPDGSAIAEGFGLNEGALDACDHSLAICGFPHYGLK